MKKNKILIITIIIFLVILGLLLYFTIHSKNELLNNISNEDSAILGDKTCEWQKVKSNVVREGTGNTNEPTVYTRGNTYYQQTAAYDKGNFVCVYNKITDSGCYTANQWERKCYATSCPAGQGQDLSQTSGCSDCAAGYYSEEGDTVCTKCPEGYTSSAGASECHISCAANETYHDGECVKCQITDVSIAKQQVSSGDTYLVAVDYQGCFDKQAISVETAGTLDTKKLDIVNVKTGSGSTKINIKAQELKDGVCSLREKTTVTHGSEVKTATILVKPDWVYKDTTINSSEYLNTSKTGADIAGKDIYADACRTENVDGWKYICTGIHVRGKECVVLPDTKCYMKDTDGNIEFKMSEGSPGKDWSEYKLNGKTVTAASKCGACFGDVKDFAHITNVTWATGNDSVHKYIYYGVTKENCVAPPKVEDACLNTSIISGAKKAAAETCGEKTSISQKETICSSDNSGTAYYKVDIDKTYSAKVDYEEYSKKPGVGFKYNVVVSEEDTVVATFDKDKWSKLYRDISTENAQYDETNPWYWYNLKRLQVLEDTLNYYNEHYVNWEIRNNKINANLSIDYKENKKDYTFGYINFIKDSVSKETKVNSKEEITIEVNNKKFKTYNIKQTVINTTILKPERVILNKQSRYINYGEITNPNYQVSGGNKIYITRNINDKQGIVYPDDGTYDISLNVDIDGNKFTNEKCSLEIDKTDLIYRIINVSNPFINKDYKKGVNWLNDNYDYTKVIRSDTWSKDAQLVISLTKDEIKKIQQDNDSNWELRKIVYNGRCSLPKNLWSEADKIVCSKIK